MLNELKFSGVQFVVLLKQKRVSVWMEKNVSMLIMIMNSIFIPNIICKKFVQIHMEKEFAVNNSVPKCIHVSTSVDYNLMKSHVLIIFNLFLLFQTWIIMYVIFGWVLKFLSIIFLIVNDFKILIDSFKNT